MASPISGFYVLKKLFQAKNSVSTDKNVVINKKIKKNMEMLILFWTEKNVQSWFDVNFY